MFVSVRDVKGSILPYNETKVQCLSGMSATNRHRRHRIIVRKTEFGRFTTDEPPPGQNGLRGA